MRSLFIVLGIYTSGLLAATLGTFTPPKVYKIIDAASYMGLGNETMKETSNLAKRTQGNVFLCNDPNFTGYCVLITGATSGGCVELGPDLDKQVSSIGPDAGQSCYFFRNHFCDAGSEVDVIQKFRTPGFTDLSLFGWDNAGSSYSCIFDGGPPLTVTFP
ncbi:hypothetical protein B0H14DRAFT_3883871 [Mycena olivaceomarginata]|nr:hypothetical protein B0H14DRAFT_3649138 [Mycena olivaceomarginata]KAJ7803699.1 hypothetical protein B0H14DRAFT_3883871 [Mycena olivaceomarginata]